MNVFEERAELERDYAAALVAGIASGRACADDGVTICPSAIMAQGGQPRSIVAAVEAISASGEKATVMAIRQWIATEVRENPRRGLVDVPAADIGQLFQTSLYGFDEGVQRLAEACRRECLKRHAEGKLMGLVTDSQQYGNDVAAISSGLTALSAELDSGPQESATLGDVLGRVFANLDAPEANAPLPTPWANVNRVLRGGMVPGELCVLAARPGMGKTALAGCIALDTAKTGKSVLFVSLEVKDETVAQRLLAREARVDSVVFRDKIQLVANVREKLGRVGGQMRNLPLRIVERSTVRMSPREVRRLARTTPNLGLVVLDYLQLMEPDDRHDSREREIADMSRTMKRLALEMDVPVLLLSQLNRRVEEGGREPQLSDLRESGAIEQDADIVMFLHATKSGQQHVNMPAKLIVAKGRSSGTGAAHLIFQKPFADFSEDDNAAAWAACADNRRRPAGNDDL